jgi:hypothetical protein
VTVYVPGARLAKEKFPLVSVIAVRVTLPFVKVTMSPDTGVLFWLFTTEPEIVAVDVWPPPPLPLPKSL